jgi:hypothetical protein
MESTLSIIRQKGIIAGGSKTNKENTCPGILFFSEYFCLGDF